MMIYDTKAIMQAAKNLTSQNDWKVLFDALEKELFEQWAKSSLTDTEFRENTHKTLAGVRMANVKAHEWAKIADDEEKRSNTNSDD